MGKAIWMAAFPKQVKGSKNKIRKPKQRQRIKPISARRRAKLDEYAKEKRRWQSIPDNRRCVITGEPADIHHTRGRIGDLLCLSALWVPVCRRVHHWIAEKPALAAKVGLLCPAGKYNTMPQPFEIKEHLYRLAFFRFLIGKDKAMVPVRPQLDSGSVIEIEKEASAAVASGFWKRL